MHNLKSMHNLRIENSENLITKLYLKSIYTIVDQKDFLLGPTTKRVFGDQGEISM